MAQRRASPFSGKFEVIRQNEGAGAAFIGRHESGAIRAGLLGLSAVQSADKEFLVLASVANNLTADEFEDRVLSLMKPCRSRRRIARAAR